MSLTVQSGDTVRDLLVKILRNQYDFILSGGGDGGGSGSGINSAVNTLTQLAAISTVATVLPSFQLFHNTDNDEMQAWKLEASTAATVTDVTQRPADYAGGTNEKVWRRIPLT